MDDSPEITQILRRVRDGDGRAVHQLLPLVYAELRAVAERAMRDQKRHHTLQPTALVNEAYLRLFGGESAWEDRAHFFGVAARAMRRILIDHARARQTQKRGGDLRKEPLWDFEADDGAPVIDLLALDDALLTLAEEESRAAQVVELRFFGGLSNDEVATVLRVTTRTVERQWRFAKTWLRRELSSES